MFALLATTWESKSLNLIQVGMQILILFSVGEVIDTISNIKRDEESILTMFNGQKLIFGIPNSPIFLLLLVTVFLLLIFYSLRSEYPKLIFYLGVFFLGVRAFILTFYYLMVGRDAGTPFSISNPKGPKKYQKMDFTKGFKYGVKDGMKSGYKAGFSFSRLISPTFFLILIYFTFIRVETIEIGQPITNLKFAFLCYSIFFVGGMLLRPINLKALPALVLIRRELYANSITNEEAFSGLSLSQAGSTIAPQLILAKNRILNWISEIEDYLLQNPSELIEIQSLSEVSRKETHLGKQIFALYGLVHDLERDIQLEAVRNPNLDSIFFGILHEIVEPLEALKSKTSESL